MNSLTAAFPGRELHVILDNINTHKKNEYWLKAHRSRIFRLGDIRSRIMVAKFCVIVR